jgi:hypothetical protein
MRCLFELSIFENEIFKKNIFLCDLIKVNISDILSLPSDKTGKARQKIFFATALFTPVVVEIVVGPSLTKLKALLATNVFELFMGIL